MPTTRAIVAQWWNCHTCRDRRAMLGHDQQSIDTLNFNFLPQQDMRDVLLIYAQLQQPRSKR